MPTRSPPTSLGGRSIDTLSPMDVLQPEDGAKKSEVAADTRSAERVEAAALRLFAVHGFEATGIRQIAQEAGLSVASLYHYMGSKEDLLDRLMRASMEHLLVPAADILQSTPDPRERIVRLVDLHVQKHAKERLLSVVADTELRSLSPARRLELVAMRDEYEAMWQETIAEGVREGYFRVADVKMAVVAVLEMCTGVAHWYSPAGRLTLDEISRAFVDMTVSLLAGPADRRAASDGKPRRHGVGARTSKGVRR